MAKQDPRYANVLTAFRNPPVISDMVEELFRVANQDIILSKAANEIFSENWIDEVTLALRSIPDLDSVLTFLSNSENQKFVFVTRTRTVQLLLLYAWGLRVDAKNSKMREGITTELNTQRN